MRQHQPQFPNDAKETKGSDIDGMGKDYNRTKDSDEEDAFPPLISWRLRFGWQWPWGQCEQVF